MRLLALVHRWAGGIVGLLLAIIGLSGTALLWEASWIGVAHAGDPARAGDAELATVMARLAADTAHPLSRITFAGDEIGVHQAIFADGGGAYLSQAGETVARWSSEWGRPELWLFDLHHRLFAGAVGETVTGILGLTGLFFVVSGAILWWRTRRTFRFRLLPPRLTRSAIVRQHRDLGIVAAPLLLVSIVSGVMMVFAPLSSLVLAPLSGGSAVRAAPMLEPAGTLVRDLDWRALFANARARFPDADFRRVQMPTKAGAPIALRLRQPFEWTPNGRSFVYVDPADGRVMAVADPAAADGAAAIHEKLYPVHSAKVGGIGWRLLLTGSGLALALLGLFATYGFWVAGGRRV